MSAEGVGRPRRALRPLAVEGTVGVTLTDGVMLLTTGGIMSPGMSPAAGGGTTIPESNVLT